MKRFLFAMFLVIIVLSGSVYGKYNKKESEVTKNPKDIVDFFLFLPGEYLYFIDGMSFQERLDLLENPGSKKLTVDLKNAYMSMSWTYDGPSGDTSVEWVITYFVKEDKTKIIAVSWLKVILEEEDGEYGEYNFYEYKNGKYADVTSKILPKISIDLFAADEDKESITATMNEMMHYRFELPQFGTVCKVYPLGISEQINDYETDGYETFRKIKENFAYSYLELKWNKAKGKFEFGKKYKK